VIVHQRIDFAGSMTDGRTVGELQAPSRSADEITQLWRYVHTQIRKHGRS
jgi:chromosome partitioning protein